MKLLTLTLTLFFATALHAQHYILTNTKLDISRYEFSNMIAASPEANYTLVERGFRETKFNKTIHFPGHAEIIAVPANGSKPRTISFSDYLEKKQYIAAKMRGNTIFIVAANQNFYGDDRVELFGVSVSALDGKVIRPLRQIGNHAFKGKDLVAIDMDTTQSGGGFFVFTDFKAGENIRTEVDVVVDEHITHTTLNNYPNFGERNLIVSANNTIIAILKKDVRGSVDIGQHYPCRALQILSFGSNGDKLQDNTIEEAGNYLLCSGVQHTPEGKLLVTGLYTEDIKRGKVNGTFVRQFDASGAPLGETVWDHHDIADFVSKMPKSLQPLSASETDLEKSGLNNYVSIRLSFLFYDPLERAQYLVYDEEAEVGYVANELKIQNMGTTVMKLNDQGKLVWVDKFLRAYRYFAYISVGSVAPYMGKDKLVIFMHDSEGMNTNPRFMSEGKFLWREGKKQLYAIPIDLKTGEASRMPLDYDDDYYITTDFAYPVGNSVFVQSKDDSRRRTGVIQLKVKD